MEQKKETQQDMENYIKKTLLPESYLLQKGIISKMNPAFFSCDAENRCLTLQFEVQEWQLNPEGILHGGMIVTAFDTVFGLLCHFYMQQNMINTIDISTTFLKPIPANCKYTITAKANHVGNTITSMTAEAHLSENNLLLATASCTFMKLRTKADDMPY